MQHEGVRFRVLQEFDSHGDIEAKSLSASCRSRDHDIVPGQDRFNCLSLMLVEVIDSHLGNCLLELLW